MDVINISQATIPLKFYSYDIYNDYVTEIPPWFVSGQDNGAMIPFSLHY